LRDQARDDIGRAAAWLTIIFTGRDGQFAPARRTAQPPRTYTGCVLVERNKHAILSFIAGAQVDLVALVIFSPSFYKLSFLLC
jgi:hypothetical protein